MLAIIDYGAGNLRSVANALTFLEIPYEICTTPESLANASRMLLPGVGHFGSAMQDLVNTGLAQAVIEKAKAGTPLAGICVGLQLLFESSEEAPGVAGLGLIEGTVRTLKTRTLPHMGWNRVVPVASTSGRWNITEIYAYFANSFAAAPKNPAVTIAETTQDDDTFPSIVASGNIVAAQFHPEKSGDAGLALFKELVQC